MNKTIDSHEPLQRYAFILEPARVCAIIFYFFTFRPFSGVARGPRGGVAQRRVCPQLLSYSVTHTQPRKPPKCTPGWNFTIYTKYI